LKLQVLINLMILYKIIRLAALEILPYQKHFKFIQVRKAESFGGQGEINN
jgi:hypothetical protein